MTSYHKRILTYDPKTEMYKVSVPELGIEVTSDTETSALLEARDEVAKAATRVNQIFPKVQDSFWADDLSFRETSGQGPTRTPDQLDLTKSPKALEFYKRIYGKWGNP